MFEQQWCSCFFALKMHLKLEPWTMDPAGPKTFTKQQSKPIKTDLQQLAGLLPFQNSRPWLWMTSAQNDITDVSYHGKAFLQHRERARQVLTLCLLLEKNGNPHTIRQLLFSNRCYFHQGTPVATSETTHPKLQISTPTARNFAIGPLRLQSSGGR